jgi:hypothetical protein
MRRICKRDITYFIYISYSTCKDGLFDCDGDECKPCEDTEYKCQTGVCIPGAGVCDGIPDCDDGTDEYPYQNCSM